MAYARSGHAGQGRESWLDAASRMRPSAERRSAAAMTLLGQIEYRVGRVQDARAWVDKVLGTTYRHPAFADLQQQLGLTQQAGGTARP